MHRVPFKVHLFVSCSTDDGPYECLIDTGAAKTVVDAHATARPALPHRDIVRGFDGTKETTMINTAITIDRMHSISM